MLRLYKIRHALPRRGQTVRVPLQEIISLALIFLCLTACARDNPQTVYEHAKRTYRGGDIAAAEAEATKGYNKFHGVSADWAWRFLILRANALHAQAKDNEALTLLASAANPPTSGELAIKRLRVQSVANAATGRTDAAESDLQQNAGNDCVRVRSISRALTCSVCVGAFEMNRGHYHEAQEVFERSFSIGSRRRGSLSRSRLPS